ncbi:MAG: asparaginase [Planctomycetota bacterium]|nr:asparaginase [Planctomycetota bacterium]
MNAPVPLVQILRGGRVESAHYGSYVVVRDGEVVEHAGDATRPTYYRSTAKPFQSMGCVLSGAAERFGFDDAMLALAAGSHNASASHLAVVRGMLAAAHLDEGALGCGGHWSIEPAVQRRQVAEVGPETNTFPAAWSNCSGKHASMLASAVALDAPLSTYLDAAHPVQVMITDIIAACAGVTLDDIHIAVDGCGAPVHELALDAMARSLYRFAVPDELPTPIQAAARRVGQAMARHPEMVAGAGRFDTDLMQGAAMTLLAKGGAEGVLGVGVPALGLGLAIKVEDGHDRGYRQLVIELLRRHGALTQVEADALAEAHGRTLRNHAGREVGRLAVAV